MLVKNRIKSRITSGDYKSLTLDSVDNQKLKPTTNYNKQLLFNWLGDSVLDRICLDLFAGSGALGLEALSRGASYIDFVENDREIYKCLVGNCSRITQNSLNYKTHFAHAIDFSAHTTRQYNLLFLDPPYQEYELIQKAMSTLITNDVLMAHTLVYIETNKNYNSILIDTIDKMIDNAINIKKKVIGKNALSLWLID